MPKAFQNERQRDILIGVAFSALLCALSVAAPVVGFFAFLLLPLPVIFYRVKLGRQPAGIIILSTLLLVMVFVGEFAIDIFFFLGIMGLGYFIGEGIEKKLPVEKIIGTASGLIFAAALCVLVVYGNLSNTGVIGVISNYIDKNYELTISLYKEMGMAEESIQAIAEAQEEVRRTLIHVMPSLFIAGLMFTGWMNFLLARVVFRRKKIPVPADMPLNTWKAPDVLVWGIIGSILLLLTPATVLKIVGINGLIVFVMIYFFQGIAIVSFYFEKKNIPFPLRVLLYGLIVIQQLLALMVIGLGFFDVWINFRKIGIHDNNQ